MNWNIMDTSCSNKLEAKSNILTLLADISKFQRSNSNSCTNKCSRLTLRLPSFKRMKIRALYLWAIASATSCTACMEMLSLYFTKHKYQLDRRVTSTTFQRTSSTASSASKAWTTLTTSTDLERYFFKTFTLA